MGTTVKEFLRSKGGVGLLVALNERGKLFTEMEPDVSVSSSTLSKRKDEALEIGLIEMVPVKHRDRTRTEYQLTEMGEDVVWYLSMEGVVSNYQAMRTHEKQVEKGKEAAIEEIYKNPGDILAHTSAMKETLKVRDKNSDSESDKDGEPDAGEGEETISISNSEELKEKMPEFIDSSEDADEESDRE